MEPRAQRLSDEEASWDLLRYLAARSSLSPAGKDVMTRVFDELEAVLGRSWPKRQASGGQGFAQLIRFIGPVSELPKVLMFFTRLHSAVGEPTFAPVLTQLKKRLDWHTWQHIQLQLEVGRLARAAGQNATYEPAIPGSARKGDLLIVAPDGNELLVETTALGRSERARLTMAFDDAVGDGVLAIEQRSGVYLAVEVKQQLDESATKRWLAAITQSAEQVLADGDARQLDGPGGLVRIQRDPFPEGTPTYSGPLLEEDLGRRLVRMVLEKGKQSTGDRRAWLRIDGQDGLFTFSPWSRMTDEDRLVELSALLRPVMSSFRHVAGVVYSSGTMFGVMGPSGDSTTVDRTVNTAHGTLIRRLLAPFVVRETLMLPAPEQSADLWETGYSVEPRWLDEDLETLGLPPLARIRP
jgi:hypothetical protein